MNRSFTTREKILLVVLTVLLLGVGYFKLFLQPMEQRVEAFQERQNTAQDQMMRKMEEELQQLKDSGAIPNAEVPVYDNIQNVMIQLNTILSQAMEYSLSFKEVSTDDTGMVFRPIDMTFTANDYDTVRSIVDDLYHCRYRCSVEDLSVNADLNLSIENEIFVDLSIVFYEKIESKADDAK